jgi:TM2 domain-containing membrane protein YozV
MEKVWVIEDPDEYLHPRKTKRLTTEIPAPIEKNPATAYSLSILIWGGGQLYNDQRRKGLIFLFLMLICFTGAILSLFYRNYLLQFLFDHQISHAHVFLIAELLFFCALIFWQYNAGDAYHTAAKARREPFRGVQSRAYPFLCSLVIPGWGQFLNGQPVKGSIFAGFSMLGIFSLVSAPSILLTWSALETSEVRLVVEGIFFFIILFAPFIPFIWIFSSFDALKVSIDDLKKESPFDRIKCANNRRRTQGWVRGVFPQIKSTILFILFFLFLLIFMYYHYSPKNYYIEQLEHAQAWLQKHGMSIIPDIIGKLRSLIARAGI